MLLYFTFIKGIYSVWFVADAKNKQTKWEFDLNFRDGKVGLISLWRMHESQHDLI